MQPFTIHFERNDKGYPAGKLADVELRFTDDAGTLAGLRLIGFALWERRSGDGYNVTMPARQYTVNGERRSYALVRPFDGQPASAGDYLKDAITAAWRAQQNPEPYRPAPVPTYTETITHDTTQPEPARYDNPADAMRAAAAGQPINILDLIGPATPPAVRADIRHEQTIRERVTTTARPRPGFTPAGDAINF